MINLELNGTEVKKEVPYYRPIGREVEVFTHVYNNHLPLLLKGPTGTGKSRFVEFMAHQLGLELITVACHDETSAIDLLGRYIVKGAETIWQDGPLTQAVREGCMVYIDEIAEARPDTLTALHPLTDHRRSLYLDRHNESLLADDRFMLVASYNPGYQNFTKELKPSTRQRFVSMSFQYPQPEVEEEILIAETGLEKKEADKLVKIASKVRKLEELGLSETVSTRLLVDAGKLIHSGLSPRLACQVAIVEPLTDDLEVAEALKNLVALII